MIPVYNGCATLLLPQAASPSISGVPPVEISNSNAIPWHTQKVSFRPNLSHKGLAILRCSWASNEYSRHPLEIQLSLPAGLRHFRKKALAASSLGSESTDLLSVGNNADQNERRVSPTTSV
jgi:hypothetical protein